MSPETEDAVPAEAKDFKAPGNETKEWRKPGAVRPREEWVATFAEQDKWVLERTLQSLESILSIPDSKDNRMTPEAREEGVMKVELLKAELEKRNAQ